MDGRYFAFIVLVFALFLFSSIYYVSRQPAMTAEKAVVKRGPPSPDEIRKPAVSGTFYPGDNSTLSSMVGGFLEKAVERETNMSVLGLISPHAGYVYSGQVAAQGYRQILGRRYDTVVLVGPSHHVSFDGAAVYDRGFFETPMELVEVDSELAGKLINSSKPGVRIFFYPKAHEGEHSIEVQLPFLQKTLKGEFKIVPIVLGNIDGRVFGDILAENIMQEEREYGKRILLVGSSDLSHYHPYDKAVLLDKTCASAVGNSTRLAEKLAEGACEMCGSEAVLSVVYAMEKLGVERIEVLDYKNSGDVSGDKSGVVGYMSVAFYKNTSASGLNAEEQKTLLELARKTLETYFREGRTLAPETSNPKLIVKQGAFVTLRKNGDLRGCIGHILPQEPLIQSVRDNALNAAFHDPRFPPLREEELKDVNIEISVLSLPQIIKVDSPEDYLKEIEVGIDGLIMKRGWRQGVLLPQVPVEWGWNKEEFLDETCRKSGLEKGCWRNPDTEVRKFQAQVFSE